MTTEILASYLPESFLQGVPCCGGGWSSPTTMQKGLDIQLRHAIPRGITLSGFLLDVGLDITNPTTTTISTTGFTYQVALKKDDEAINGAVAVIAEGSLEEGITVPGGETTQVVLPMNCSFGGVGSLGKDLLLGKHIAFVLSGETQYEIPMTETTYTLPYQVEGAFSPSTTGGN